MRVAEVTVGGNRMDLTLMGPDKRINRTENISNLPIVTRSGLVLPASSLAKIVVTSSPDQIRHLERVRTVTLQIRPSRAVALEVAMEQVRHDVMDKLKA